MWEMGLHEQIFPFIDCDDELITFSGVLIQQNQNIITAMIWVFVAGMHFLLFLFIPSFNQVGPIKIYYPWLTWVCPETRADMGGNSFSPLDPAPYTGPGGRRPLYF